MSRHPVEKQREGVPARTDTVETRARGHRPGKLSVFLGKDFPLYLLRFISKPGEQLPRAVTHLFLLFVWFFLNIIIFLFGF